MGVLVVETAGSHSPPDYSASVQSAADFSGKHRAKSAPPIPHCFTADVDAAFVQ